MLDSVTVPDLWQQEAVSALHKGQDVVVHAPTGAGKTLIFELWTNMGKPKGKAVYTVPTRALANDKLSEWRARDWPVAYPATWDHLEPRWPLEQLDLYRRRCQSEFASRPRHLMDQ